MILKFQISNHVPRFSHCSHAENSKQCKYNKSIFFLFFRVTSNLEDWTERLKWYSAYYSHVNPLQWDHMSEWIPMVTEKMMTIQQS